MLHDKATFQAILDTGFRSLGSSQLKESQVQIKDEKAMTKEVKR